MYPYRHSIQWKQNNILRLDEVGTDLELVSNTTMTTLLLIVIHQAARYGRRRAALSYPPLVVFPWSSESCSA